MKVKSDLSFDPPKDCNRLSIEIKNESKNILYFWFQNYSFVTNKQKLTYLTLRRKMHYITSFSFNNTTSKMRSNLW